MTNSNFDLELLKETLKEFPNITAGQFAKLLPVFRKRKDLKRLCA